MPKNKKKKTIRHRRPLYKRPLFVLFLIIFVFATGLLVAKFLDEKGKVPNPSASSEVEEKKEAPEKPEEKKSEEKKEEASAPESSDSSPDGKTPEKYDGENANLSESLTGSISSARFSGEKLIIRVNIDQYLSSGTCSLTLSDGASSLSKTANLVPEAATSSCEGFDIPAIELENFSRPIYINLTLTSGDRSGTLEGSVE